ncbi:sensor of ECF-type sigma factor [Aureitalea sp. L0-47]|uniref:sensor of ECF-type sigma factor n=1 Tax=Aureitalea sp. L0-47 TaxID=2816962 RepID=UPI0022388CF4|nr:sensor of ECF-type sigma factor [Aureitalea sp. L0-47]MCW5519731.1 sensor of ECF-type sigma factor [Aureitalea sp. L0-47]
MKNLLIILLLFASTLQAQRPGSEQIQALKTAHITQTLDLTSEEAEKFWPIYNKFDQQLEKNRKQERREIVSMVKGDVGALSDEEAEKLIEKMIDFKENQFTHYKNLVQELKGVIPPQKILRLRKAEEDFRRILMEQLRKRRKGRQ